METQNPNEFANELTTVSGAENVPCTPIQAALQNLESLYNLWVYGEQPFLTESILEKREFTTVKEGTQYLIPHYHLVPGKGIEKDGDELIINYVRGVTNDPDWPQQPGVLNETLLAMIEQDLRFKAGEVPDENTQCAIKCVQLANMFLALRQHQRTQANVLNTSHQTPK